MVSTEGRRLVDWWCGVVWCVENKVFQYDVSGNDSRWPMGRMVKFVVAIKESLPLIGIGINGYMTGNQPLRRHKQKVRTF